MKGSKREMRRQLAWKLNLRLMRELSWSRKKNWGETRLKYRLPFSSSRQLLLLNKLLWVVGEMRNLRFLF